MESDDTVSLLQEGLSYAAHNRVHARCGAATREDGNRFVLLGHIMCIYLNE